MTRSFLELAFPRCHFCSGLHCRNEVDVKQYKYTVLVPVEITLDSPTQLKDVVRDIKKFGPYPVHDSFSTQCYSWRTRHDLARLKNTKAVRP